MLNVITLCLKNSFHLLEVQYGSCLCQRPLSLMRSDNLIWAWWQWGSCGCRGTGIIKDCCLMEGWWNPQGQSQSQTLWFQSHPRRSTPLQTHDLHCDGRFCFADLILSRMLKRELLFANCCLQQIHLARSFLFAALMILGYNSKTSVSESNFDINFNII